MIQFIWTTFWCGLVAFLVGFAAFTALVQCNMRETIAEPVAWIIVGAAWIEFTRLKLTRT